MNRILCIVEGETEREFCINFLSLPLSSVNLFLMPQLVNYQGGNLNYIRVKLAIENLLKKDKHTHVTTFFDLYALRNNFPSYEEAQNINDLYKKVEFLEATFKKDICGENSDFKHRFFPHIQPYEFEALLFSDVEKVAQIFPQETGAKEKLLKIRSDFPSPEHINGKKETSPSHRLGDVLTKPRYKKVSHGLQACQKIGLEKILSECQHFKNWYNKILALQPLDKE